MTGIDEATGELFHLKVLTTNQDPALGVVESLDEAGIRLEQVSLYLGLGV